MTEQSDKICTVTSEIGKLLYGFSFTRFRLLDYFHFEGPPPLIFTCIGFNFINIAKSEQSSHTPGSSHRRLLERKKNWTNKGTDKQYVADSFIHIKTCHK